MSGRSAMLAVILLAGLALPAAGQPPAWRTTRVPADDPALWPPGDWRPVPRLELESFLASRSLPRTALPAPPLTPWAARYVAQFDAGRLRGTCELHMPMVVASGTDVQLQPLNVSLSNLQGPNGPAEWGLRSDGITVIRAAPANAILTADWESPGRPVFDGWQFDLQLPLTTTMGLDLDLPQDWQLRTSAGVLTGPTTAPQAEFQRWHITAGRRTQLQLIVAPPAQPAAERVLVSESHSVTVLSDGLDVVSDFEVTTGSPAALAWELPRGFQVLAMTHGADARLPFEVRRQDNSSILRLSTSRVAIDAGRIRLRGFVAADVKTLTAVPLPRLQRGAGLESLVTLHVRPPQVLQQLVTDGYRVADRRSDAENIESWVLQSLRADPALSIAVDTPLAELTAQVLQWADFRGPVARLRSRWQIRGGGGPTFELQARCPSSWDVVGVAPFRGEAATIIAGFETDPDEIGGWQRLTVQLRQPLAPDGELDLLVTAVAAAPELKAPVDVPTLQPVGSLRTTGLLAVAPPAGADISGTLALASSLDRSDRLADLQAAVGSTDLSSAVLFEWPAADLPAPPATITFDPLPTAAESSTAVRSPAAPEAPPSSPDEPEWNRLRLTTRLATPGKPDAQHVLEAELRRPFRGTLRFRLAAPAQHVQLFNGDIAVPLEKSADEYSTAAPISAQTDIRIAYRTPAPAAAFLPRQILPLPVWTDTPLPLTWVIHPSPSAACWQASAPFGRVVECRDSSWLERLFGPLAASPGPVGPAPAEGDASVPQQPTVQRETARGILRYETAVAPAALSLTTWNPSLSERGSWAVLMLALLVGGSLRKLRSARLRGWLPALCVALFGLAWFAPEPLARPAGAACVGMVLSFWLPRRMVAGMPAESDTGQSMVHSRARDSRVTRTAGAVASSLCLLLHCAPGLLAQPLSPEPATVPAAPAVLLPERDGEAASTAYLNAAAWTAFQTWLGEQPVTARWLLRQAEYELQLARTARLIARYEVLCPPGGERFPVRLGLNGVTFESLESATIDGAPTTIIPTMQGDGIIVMVEPPPAATAADRTTGTTSYGVRRVEIRCQVPVASAGNGFVSSFQIPPVAGSTLFCRADEPLGTLLVNGRVVAVPSTAPLSLGPATQIVARWWNSAASAGASPRAGSITAAGTLIDVEPLQHRAHTVLELSPAADADTQWQIPLQPEWTIRNVEAPPEIRWRVTTGAGGPQLELAALQPASAARLVSISAVRPVDASRSDSRTTPLVSLLRHQQSVREVVALRTPAGFDVQLLDRGAPGAGSAAVWLEIPSAIRSALGKVEAEGLTFGPAHDWSLRLTPQATIREATLDTRIALQRPLSTWQATVLLNVTGAPTARHELRLGPEVMLSQLQATADGADRLSRSRRAGDRLELVLVRPLSGPLRIDLTGQWAAPILADQPLPRLQVADCLVVAESCRVSNLSDWEAELTPEGGPPQRIAAAGSAVAGGEAQLAGSAAAVPQRLRLHPGEDAAVWRSYVQILSDGLGGWLQRQTLILEPRGAPLTTVTLQVPPAMQSQLSIQPAGDIQSTVDDPGGVRRIEFRPQSLRGGLYRIQLQAALTPPAEAVAWEYMSAECVSARAAEQFLQVDAAFPFRPTAASGEVVPLTSVPLRLRPQRRSAGAVITNLLPARSGWTLAPFDRGSPGTTCPLVETIIWLDPPAGVRGQSTFTLVTAEPDVLRLDAPAGVRIDEVTIDDRVGVFRSDARQVSIDLPAGLSGAAVVVNWSLPPSQPMATAVAYLRPSGFATENHVCALVAAGAPPVRLMGGESNLNVECRRMAGLLTAVERLASRTFPLDSPLLESLRWADAQLERASKSAAGDDELVAECRRLRERWRRAQSLIAVEAASPTAGGASVQRPWERLHFDSGISVQRLSGNASAVPVRTSSTAARPLAILALLGGLFFVLLSLRRHSGWQSLADWLADRPAWPCLALGTLWIAYLEPRPVGVLLVLAGLTLLSRRRTASRHQDTALIGPGR